MTHTENCEKAFLKYGNLTWVVYGISIPLKRGTNFKSKHYNSRKYSYNVADKYVKKFQDV